jgi:probable rRNA maturation factor
MQEHSRRERAGRDVRSHKTLCTKTLGIKTLGKTLGTKTLGTKTLGTMPHSIIPMTEVLVVADCWQDEPEAEAVIQRAIAAAAETVDADVGDAELAVMLTDDSGIRTLNSNWRGIDKPTNVLSFPALQPTAARRPEDAPRMLGDIAIAYQTMRKEADDEGKPFDHHLSHLAVHGFLHLIGYDHERDDQAEAMEALEREILAQLGIPDPYADRQRVD